MQYAPIYLATFVLSWLMASVGTPLVREAARRWGALDQPSARKVHLQPVPLLGGLAIYIGFWVGLLLVSRLEIARDAVFLPAITSQLVGIFAGSAVIVALGIVDDKYTGLAPRWKLAGQGLAAGVLLLFGIRFQIFDQLWLNLALTVLWVLYLSNAINFLDNMDGLSAGATAIAAGFFFLLAALHGQILVSIMALALAGGCLGFLRYNFNPASVFMGDTGSLFLGFALAIIGIKLDLGQSSWAPWWTLGVAAVVLALPIFDTSLVTLHRLVTGRRVTQGGTDHTSHRLVKLGLPHRRAVLVLYAASVCAGALAVALSQADRLLAASLGLPSLLVALWLGLLLARVKT